ncbi:Alpha-galactosidase (plasmid) [Roseomonas mucosa]|uniref:alpha-glucosidase/alpha-galactosidase n=1 Tax=Roseomonas TaxID=125216 RepID=UPI00095A97EB|nr:MULTISPECIES: alpha-glucosidase/alpha-galactosidase [Roseomonas]ATR18987.1 alpha-glucosidase/alpha-galactosidase [Roseomonas sp. FDAARGOS_362]USQ73847.1 alpha-glucosidase/alpha-galactosidase [Roseomonas mucosa]UZO99100.1 Alpha-galactosidase [Roseomonas mucosa]GAV34578.1 alpha-galactosidase [Roseomonas sp. TAS13]
MTKIAMIGAGSVVFVKNLLTDILSLPSMKECEIALHDIDPERLETAGMMARWTSGQFAAGAAVTEHADRRRCLEGADFVINMVQIGMHQATLLDFDIPRRYGLKQTIADTVGIGGIFRGLRTIPFMMDLVRDMRAVCPGALLLNYTNPMSILTWAVYRAFPEQQVVGLCHNVQHTARDLASYLGVDRSRLSYDCAGINHMTWFLRLEIDGKDAYPQLRRAARNPEIFAKDKIRFELMEHLGRFVSESSEHTAEYTPYFLRREDQIAEYDVPVDEYVRRSERNLRRYAETRQKLLAGDSFPLERSDEYGAAIINGMVTGEPQLIYGNVRNTGLIENLPRDCCVEVPVIVDRNGLRACYVGTLPPELAAHCAPHVFVQELTVRAALEGDRDAVYRAAVLDRHAASVLSLREIRSMVDDLIAAHGHAMPLGVRQEAMAA